MKIGTTLLRKRIAICAATVCLLAPLAQARRTVKEKKQAALTQYDAAEKLRSVLTRKAEARRTRADYEQAMEAYRKVYHTAPNSVRADISILTVAELLDEQGRLFHDEKSYSDAIGQLVFLRREYPGSKYRVPALFTIGEIYRDDLRDQAQAKATFEDYIKHYPNSSLAPDARAILTEITESEKRDPFKKKSARPVPEVTAKAAWVELPSPKREQISEQAATPSSDDQEQVKPANTLRSSRKKTTDAPVTIARPASQSDADATVAPPQPLDTALDKIESPGQPHKTSRMTGV